MKQDYRILIIIGLAIIFVLAFCSMVNAQAYNMAVTKYKAGEITDIELLNILDGRTKLVSPGNLDALANEYISENFGEVTTQAFDPISIITGFVAFLKNEKVKSILDGLFGRKRCDFDKLAQQVGKQYIIEILEEQGIAIPEELKASE